MRIEKLDPPEVLTQGGLTANLTHKRTAIRIDPGDPVFPVTITESKGWIQEDGSFKDWGPHASVNMDAEGYRAFVQATGGDCKISDLKPAIEKRIAAIEKAKADAQAAADAEEKSKQADFNRQVETMTAKTTVNRAQARPAGPDAVAQ